MDQDDRQSAPQGPGGSPAGTPTAPPAFTATPAGPTPPAGTTAGRPGPPTEGPRPLPLITSLAGAAGALFLLSSLALFLSELGGDSKRLGGVVVCLLFQGLGVGLMVLTRGRASTTAGVGLTALAVIPLVIYLFVDIDDPGKTIDSPSSFTNTATMILLASAAAWLVGYFVGPGRRYGIYLGGALLAVWLVAVVQIVDNPLGQIFNPFQTEARFQSVGSAIGPGPNDDGMFYEDDFSDEYYEDDFFSGTSSDDDFFMPSQDDDFGTDFDDDFGFEDEFGYEDDFFYEDPYGSVDDPSTKLGWTSLLFGGAYLALAAWRDRRGDARTGTPFVAVAAPILLVSVAFLSSDFGDTGTPMLAIAIGAAQVFVGTRRGRRFTSWIGLLTATYGVVMLVDQAVGDSARVSAIVLLLLGVGVTLLALALDGGLNLGRDDDGPAGPSGPGLPPPEDGGAWWSREGATAPVTPAASPWSAPNTPPTAPPMPPSPSSSSSAPPTSPTSSPAWQPPPLEASPSPPWASSTPDSATLWSPPTQGDPEPPTGNP